MDAPREREIDWPALEAAHAIEPELRQNPPRRVVSRAQPAKWGARLRGCAGGGCLGCALSAIFVLGLFLSLWAGLALLILPFGTTTQGTITAHELTRGQSPRYGSSESYLLTFEFRPPGAARTYQGEGAVGGETFLRLRDGDSTKVRYFAFAPGLRPLLEEGVSPWLMILFVGPLGLLMLLIGGLPVLGLLPQPGKRLVKRGVPVAAIVTARAGNNATFCFRVSNAQGETRVIEATQYISPQSATHPPVGAVVTVLFDPRRPQRALIYQACAWRARPQSGVL